MRIGAILFLGLAANLASAAPTPFVERAVREAVLETGNNERTQALLRWIKATDLAATVAPGKGALPPSFLAKLKMDVKPGGGQVVLRLDGAGTPDERAMFKKLLATVTRPAAGHKHDLAIQAGEAEIMVMRRKVIMMGGRGGRFRGDDIEFERYRQQQIDAEIRANPPRLVVPAR